MADVSRLRRATQKDCPTPTPVLAKNWCHSQLAVDNFSFEWTIENFSFQHQKIESSKFSGRSTEWYLSLHPMFLNEESKSFLSLFLILHSSKRKQAFAFFKIYIVNTKGQITTHAIMASSVKCFLQGIPCGSEQFILRDCLLYKAKSLLPGNKLTIICELSVTGDSVNVSGQDKMFKIPEYRLADDLSDLLVNQKLCDVTLYVSGKEFKAHKAILAARSEVFEAMFVHETAERLQNQVVIKDVEPNVLEEMLKFIYTGKVSNLSDIADRLIVAADKYALRRLKVLCEEELFLKITIENAADTLILADLVSATQLKAQTIKFVCAHSTQVKNTSGFKEMVISDPHLLVEAFLSMGTQEMPAIP